jgi:hypothetical protein
MATKQELEARLAALDHQMDSLIAEHPDDGDFWCAFAGIADDIGDAATADQYDWAQEKIDAILMKHGKAVPRDLPPSDC